MFILTGLILMDKKLNFIFAAAKKPLLRGLQQAVGAAVPG